MALQRIKTHYEVIETTATTPDWVLLRCKDTRNDRELTLKASFLPKNPEMEDTLKLVWRCQHDAKICHAANHPGVPRAREFGYDEACGAAFIAFPPLEGETLTSRLNSDPLNEDEARWMLLELIRIVHRLHEKGIIHRNLSTDSVFLVQGQPKLIAFDWASFRGQAPIDPVDDELGRHAFVLPDMLDDSRRRELRFSHRRDAWSLGLIGIALAGRKPAFAGMDRDQIARLIKNPDVLKEQLLSPLEKHSFHSLIKQMLDADEVSKDWLGFFNRQAAMARKAEPAPSEPESAEEDDGRVPLIDPEGIEKPYMIEPDEAVAPEPEGPEDRLEAARELMETEGAKSKDMMKASSRSHAADEEDDDPEPEEEEELSADAGTARERLEAIRQKMKTEGATELMDLPPAEDAEEPEDEPEPGEPEEEEYIEEESEQDEEEWEEEDEEDSEEEDEEEPEDSPPSRHELFGIPRPKDSELEQVGGKRVNPVSAFIGWLTGPQHLPMLGLELPRAIPLAIMLFVFGLIGLLITNIDTLSASLTAPPSLTKPEPNVEEPVHVAEETPEDLPEEEPEPITEPVTEPEPPSLLPGKLIVKSEPSGARIYIDGRNTGAETPEEFDDVAAGRHSVEVRLEGWNTQRRTLSLEPEGETEYTFEMVSTEPRPQFQTVDSQGDSGVFASLAFDSRGNPGISYLRRDSGTVRYASWDGNWDHERVATAGSGCGGTSLGFIGRDVPLIIFHQGAQDRLESATLGSDGRWNTGIVDSRQGRGRYPSLSVSPGGDPAAAYYDNGVQSLVVSRWYENAWHPYTVNYGNVGKSPNAYHDARGNLYVTYYDAANEHLRMATYTGSTWRVSTVDNSPQVGWYSSIVRGPDGRLWISYRDYQNDDLKIAHETANGWAFETADSAGLVGEYSSLGFDRQGRAVVAYHDSSNKDLKLAIRDNGRWTASILDSTGYVGEYCSLAIDSSGSPAIAYYDRTNGALKVAWFK